MACYFPALWDFQPWGRTGALARAIACLAPQAGAGPLRGREGAPRNRGEPLPCGRSVGAWGGMSSRWCPLLPLIPAMQPLSLPFLKPMSRCPLCFGGKLRCKALVGKEADFYRQASPISVCHACRLPAPGAPSLHLAGSKMCVPKRSGQESLPHRGG